ncbi:hypothetical protein YC2023_052522 [Brassica napus]
MLNHPASYFHCHPSTDMYTFDRWRHANDFGSCALSLYSRSLHVRSLPYSLELKIASAISGNDSSKSSLS